MDKIRLVNLCSRTWALTALGLMENGISGRVSPLAAAAGCGRTSMSASVEHLVLLGLLEKNPGHGHPLRPEYRFTSQGAKIAEWALELDSFVKSDDEKILLRNKWTLPLLSCIDDEARYSEIRRQLIPVTDRALSASLGKLTNSDWLKRKVKGSTSPPIVSYCTLNKGKKLHNHILQLPGVA